MSQLIAELGKLKRLDHLKITPVTFSSVSAFFSGFCINYDEYFFNFASTLSTIIWMYEIWFHCNCSSYCFECQIEYSTRCLSFPFLIFLLNNFLAIAKLLYKKTGFPCKSIICMQGEPCLQIIISINFTWFILFPNCINSSVPSREYFKWWWFSKQFQVVVHTYFLTKLSSKGNF